MKTHSPGKDLCNGMCVFGPIVQWLGHLIFNQGI